MANVIMWAYNGSLGAMLIEKSVHSSQEILSSLQFQDKDWRSEEEDKDIRLKDKDKNIDKDLKIGSQGFSGTRNSPRTYTAVNQIKS